MSHEAPLGPDGLVDWVGRRRPVPPPDLRERLEDELRACEPAPGPEDPAAARSGALLAIARRRLNSATARPGRVRDTAFELLIADALVTYACEAALQEERPHEALRRILEG